MDETGGTISEEVRRERREEEWLWRRVRTDELGFIEEAMKELL
jgi:hypothetical protein